MEREEVERRRRSPLGAIIAAVVVVMMLVIVSGMIVGCMLDLKIVVDPPVLQAVAPPAALEAS